MSDDLREREDEAVAALIRAARTTDLSELRRLNKGEGIEVADGERVHLNDDEWELAAALVS
jgi:hypothetical protein